MWRRLVSFHRYIIKRRLPPLKLYRISWITQSFTEVVLLRNLNEIRWMDHKIFRSTAPSRDVSKESLNSEHKLICYASLYCIKMIWQMPNETMLRKLSIQVAYLFLQLPGTYVPASIFMQIINLSEKLFIRVLIICIYKHIDLIMLIESACKQQEDLQTQALKSFRTSCEKEKEMYVRQPKTNCFTCCNSTATSQLQFTTRVSSQYFIQPN